MDEPRLTCRCGRRFYRKHGSQEMCRYCIENGPNGPRYVTPSPTQEELAVMERERHWKRWIVGFFEPHLGDKAMNPLIVKLLGRKVEAA